VNLLSINVTLGIRPHLDGARHSTQSRDTDHGLIVGRQKAPGQIVLDHPNVSRRHAAFELAGETIILRDLGDTIGTYVNGVRLHGTRFLVPGDRIDIGSFQLTFDGIALTRAWRVGNVMVTIPGVRIIQS
jgi:pSer/pThr/pTyr-binding forkhead associated (FHA) protein